jgi:hypothetical protein
LAAQEIVAVAGEDDDARRRHELAEPLVGTLRELCVCGPESLVEEQDVRSERRQDREAKAGLHPVEYE